MNELPTKCLTHLMWTSSMYIISFPHKLLFLTKSCLQLEYDTKRAGDFKPLRYLPLDKIVVLGLVTTKNSKVS